jgi:hypothetical protein
MILAGIVYGTAMVIAAGMWHHLYEGRTLLGWVDQVRQGNRNAVPVLVRIGSPAVPHMLQVLRENRDFRSCVFARQVLVRLRPHSPETIAALVDLLRLRQERVTEFASAILGDIGLPAAPTLLEALAEEAIRKDAEEILGDMVGQIIPLLLRAMDDPREPVRLAIIDLLYDATPAEALPVIRKALQDRAASVRCQAIVSLVIFARDVDETLSVLVGATRDPDREVRLLGVRLLGLIRYRAGASLVAVVLALVDEDRWVRRSAVGALAKLHPAWRPPPDYGPGPTLERCIGPLRRQTADWLLWAQ